MTIETATYISDLNGALPAATDPEYEGDDHIRLVKTTVKTTFPNVTGAVTPTQTELNYVAGVTSALQTQLNAKISAASPALTGTPTAPTAAPGTNTTQIATTAYADAIGALKAPLASPALTGTPTAPTAAPSTNTTQIATTAYVDTADALKAPLDSPTFTGDPKAPTATLGDNDTSIATTAFVTAAINAIPAPSSLTLLGTIATTSGTTATLSGMTLTSYKFLKVYIRGVTNTSTTAIVFNSINITTSNAAAKSGILDIGLSDGFFTGNSTLTSGTLPATTLGASGITNASTSITFTVSSAYTAGNIDVYGIK